MLPSCFCQNLRARAMFSALPGPTFGGGNWVGGYLRPAMDPYAKPKERKVGPRRPQIEHLPQEIDRRTRQQRQADKQAIAAERRAIKKSARQHLKRQLTEDVEQ